MVDKYTDEQIIKALEWCEQFEDNIVLFNMKVDKFTFALQSLQTIKQVLKNHNRQKAEIDELRQNLREAHIDIKEHMADIESLIEDIEGYRKFPCFTKDTQFVSVSRKADGQFTADKMIQMEIDKIRAEAVTEFAERFEKKIKDVQLTLGQTWEIQCAIKDVKKEMTEGKI